jgi:hypothetical protein
MPTDKSAVSRRFIAATERQMAKWLGRDLGALDLGVLMIDGVVIDAHVLLVALGIDADGKKHVLGSGCARARPRTPPRAPRCSPICASAACAPTAPCSP